MKKTILAFGVLCMMIVTCLVFVPTKAKADVLGPAMTFTIPCIADTWVDRANPNTNYGLSPDSITDLIVNGLNEGFPYNFNQRDSYWKFNMSLLPANLVIDKATAHFYLVVVYNYNYTFSGFDAFTTATLSVTAPWSETALTWNNRPSIGPVYFSQFVSVPRIAPGNAIGYSWPDAHGVFHPDDPANYTAYSQYFNSYIPVDLTTLTQMWYNTTLQNNGVLFDIGWGTGWEAMMEFYTRHVTNAWLQGAPYLEITAHSIETQVHLSYYDAFTGEGIAPWTFNVSASLNGGTWARIISTWPHWPSWRPVGSGLSRLFSMRNQAGYPGP